jgi:lysophospholipase L1-like esterase
MSNRQKVFPVLTAAGVLGLVLVLDFASKNTYQAFRRVSHGRVAHPLYDHGIRENFHWNDKYGPLEAPFFSNSLGFRDSAIREIPLKANLPRVLLIGDSYCEGVGIPWERTFAGILEKKLKPQGIEVLNAGVMSYTPILEKIKIRYLLEARDLEFHQVVLFLDLSDIKDELFYEEDEQGRARLIPYGPFASQAGWGTWVENFGEFCENVVEPNFVLLGALARNLKIELRQATRKELGKRGAFTTLPDWIQYWETEDPPKKEIADQGIKKLQETLDELADYLQKENIKFTLVIFPRQEYSMRGSMETKVQKIWREWSAIRGVELLDLFPAFSGPDSSRFYIPGDGHWDEEGHRLVAEALLKKFQKDPPMKPR